MSRQVFQTKRFARNPYIGEKKKGDLSGLWVYKFRCQDEPYLLGYTRDEGVKLV